MRVIYVVCLHNNVLCLTTCRAIMHVSLVSGGVTVNTIGVTVNTISCNGLRPLRIALVTCIVGMLLAVGAG